jgi:hypothetical protein
MSDARPCRKFWLWSMALAMLSAPALAQTAAPVPAASSASTNLSLVCQRDERWPGARVSAEVPAKHQGRTRAVTESGVSTRFQPDGPMHVDLGGPLELGSRWKWQTRLWVHNLLDAEPVVEPHRMTAPGLPILPGLGREIAIGTVGRYSMPRIYGLEIRLTF